MTYQLYCGDCAKVMAEQIADESIDLTVTSPPYDNLRTYNGYTFDFEAIAQQLWRVTKPGGVVVWVVGDQTVDGDETDTAFSQALFFKKIGFLRNDTMIWNKFLPGNFGTRYCQSFEYMFIMSKGKVKTFNPLKKKNRLPGASYQYNQRYGGLTQNGTVKRDKTWEVAEMGVMENVWRIQSEKNSVGHPAPFPESLAKDHILSWSNPGDVVLDPMCGSGTTGKMAISLQRNFIGIDISSEYLQIAEERIRKATYQPSLFAQPQPEQYQPVAMFE